MTDKTTADPGPDGPPRTPATEDDPHEEANAGGAPRKGDDDVLVEALATGMTNERAGELAGMSERTVRRRRKEPAITQRVVERRLEISQEATARMGTLYATAIDVIEDAMSDGPTRDRLAAAKLLLQTAPGLRAHTEMEERLAAVERDLVGTAPDTSDGAVGFGWPGELR